MGKLYILSEYKLKKELKDLKKQLATRLEYCDKNGYNWFDHYSIRELHFKINGLKKRIKNEQEGSS
jgi:nuclear transport factor 2 (NTF2) superfamily protein